MPPPTAGSRTLADLPVPRRSSAENDAANHQFGNRFGREIAALALLLRRRVLSQVELVRLTQDTDGDVREVQVGPLLLPAEKQLAIRRPSEHVSQDAITLGRRLSNMPSDKGSRSPLNVVSSQLEVSSATSRKSKRLAAIAGF